MLSNKPYDTPARAASSYRDAAIHGADYDWPRVTSRRRNLVTASHSARRLPYARRAVFTMAISIGERRGLDAGRTRLIAAISLMFESDIKHLLADILGVRNYRASGRGAG